MEIQPGQPLEYATPVAPRRRANFVLAVACFGLVMMIGGWMLAVVQGGPSSLLFVMYFLGGIAVPLGVNCLGFMVALFLIRPAADSRRWRPYFMSAVAGISALLLEWVAFWEAERLGILEVISDWSVAFGGGLIASAIVLWFYRIATASSLSATS